MPNPKSAADLLKQLPYDIFLSFSCKIVLFSSRKVHAKDKAQLHQPNNNEHLR